MNFHYLFFIISLLFAFESNAQNVTLSGPVGCGAASVAGTWTVPCNVTSISIEIYGGGGGAGGGGGGSNGGLFNTRGGGGAGGGGYTTITINVVPSSTFSYSIGAGGCGGSGGGDGSSGNNGNNGGATTFSGTAQGGGAVSLTANGGQRGTGGSGTGGSTGSGGSGGTASGGTTNTTGSNGNGGSGGNGGNGGSGAGPSGGAGGAVTAAAGTALGGGGAGGGDSPGGRGAAGGVLITYVTTTPLPATPLISSTAATCATAGSSTISNYDATLPYTFTPSGPTVGAGGVITGMTIGTSYTVVAGVTGCTSTPSNSFSNAATISPPAIPTIAGSAPTCTADGSSTISNYNASYTYNFTPSGPAVGAGGAISGMTNGTNYTVVANNGSCNSNASNTFSNSALLPTPAIPTITAVAATCTNSGSSTINNYVATQSYTFTPSGPTVNAGGAISGMTLGTSYTVITTNSTCSSNASASFSNAAAIVPPVAPAITSTAPSCTADGSSTITNYNASYTYNFTPSGPTVGAGGAIGGMTNGTNYTVIADDGSCSSNASNAFSNSAQLQEPVASISGNLSYCVGSNTTLTASGGIGYAWNDASANNIGSAAAVTVTQGTYTVIVTGANSCTATASATVTELSNLVISIGGDLNHCPSKNTTLTASGGSSYVWSNGNTTADITVTHGTHSVTASDAGCTGTASAVVTQRSVSAISLGNDTTLCVDSTLVIDAGTSYVSYNWSTGDTTQTISPKTSGAFAITATDVNGCETSKSINVTFNSCTVDENFILIPTAFSPNNDGNNDLFRFKLIGNVKFIDLRIFNRWGERIFYTTDERDFWNGTFKDVACPVGAYIYEIRVLMNGTKTKSQTGNITLLR